MDLHAALMANRLLNNPPWAPVFEMLVQGAKFEALCDVWVAIGGADAMANRPRWRAVRLRSGERLIFPHNQSGVWIYLAVEGGFAARRWLDSASALVPAGIGRHFETGDLLMRDESEPRFELPRGVSGRMTLPADQRDYINPPRLRVHRGPQWEMFSRDAHDALSTGKWTVGSQSNRVGYRLEGPLLEGADLGIISEPMRVGTLQVTEGGQLLAIMRDGPTVGGYPKIGLIHPDDVNWLSQCRPGQSVQFDVESEGAGWSR